MSASCQWFLSTTETSIISTYHTVEADYCEHCRRYTGNIEKKVIFSVHSFQEDYTGTVQTKV